MKVYRLSKQKYAEDLSGKGAELSGGRWNSKGTRVIYTSDSRALCTAEIAVHSPIGLIPQNYFLVIIEIPDNISIAEVKIEDLPENWRDFPFIRETKDIGDDFIINKNRLILKVPSAVVQGDFNYLINPSHKDFKKIRIKSIEPFSFDERLFK